MRKLARYYTQKKDHIIFEYTFVVLSSRTIPNFSVSSTIYPTLSRTSLYPRRLRLVMGGCISGVLLIISKKSARLRLV